MKSNKIDITLTYFYYICLVLIADPHFIPCTTLTSNNFLTTHTPMQHLTNHNPLNPLGWVGNEWNKIENDLFKNTLYIHLFGILIRMNGTLVSLVKLKYHYYHYFEERQIKDE